MFLRMWWISSVIQLSQRPVSMLLLCVAAESCLQTFVTIPISPIYSLVYIWGSVIVSMFGTKKGRGGILIFNKEDITNGGRGGVYFILGSKMGYSTFSFIWTKHIHVCTYVYDTNRPLLWQSHYSPADGSKHIWYPLHHWWCETTFFWLGLLEFTIIRVYYTPFTSSWHI